LERSALVEAAAQLTRALDHIASQKVGRTTISPLHYMIVPNVS
jgi:hypothetical protein